MATITCDGSELGVLATPTRNRYFYGKLLDVFHFDLEQTYLNRQRWLVNRLGLGSGVLCGCAIGPSPDGAGIVVEAGVAIDPYGREVVVPATSPLVDPRRLTDPCGKPYGDPVAAGATVTICLTYHECAAEPVPALICDCGDNSCESSSVRERYAVTVQADPPELLDLECPFPNLFVTTEAGSGPRVSYPDLLARVDAPCIDVWRNCVVLGQVTISDEGQPITADLIDVSNRRIVYSNQLLAEMFRCLPAAGLLPGGGIEPTPTHELTHIADISWHHDGAMTVGDFMSGLKVTFDRPIAASPRARRSWFLVDLEFPWRQDAETPMPFVRDTVGVVRLLEEEVGLTDAQTAVFRPVPAFSELIKRTGEDALVRVRLLCDFLVDEERRPVDGNFLGGTLPTGDGTPGGVFESWFQLGAG